MDKRQRQRQNKIADLVELQQRFDSGEELVSEGRVMTQDDRDRWSDEIAELAELLT